MPADFQKVILDDYILKKHIDRTGLQSDFSLQPDHTDVLRTGPDVSAAMNASRNALNNLNKQSETVDDVNAMMLNVIDMTALCTDLPRDQAYNLLVTGNVAA
jgi:hypothetical protein